MATQKSIIKQLEKIISEIKLSGINIKKAFLFGSYATNTQHKWSDVDLALVSDEFTGFDFDDVGMISKVLIKYPTLLIQPRTYKSSQFTPKKDPIVEEIIRTGVEIRI